MKHSVYKVPDGKLIKVKLWTEGESISKVTITGDFFLHPEYVLENIEAALIDVPLLEVEITSAIDTVIQEEEATLIGATSSDFSRAILRAE
jgi:lipoate-protein ligase A